MPFSDVKLEKLFIFNKFLNKKLPTINDPLPFNIREDVDMDSYKIVDGGQQQFDLVGDEGLKPASNGNTGYQEEVKAKLSQIIIELNEAFGTDFTEDDKVFLEGVKNI